MSLILFNRAKGLPLALEEKPGIQEKFESPKILDQAKVRTDNGHDGILDLKESIESPSQFTDIHSLNRPSTENVLNTPAEAKRTRKKKQEEPPLYWAARRGNPQKLKHCLDNGMDPNIPYPSCMYKWPLFAAVKFQNVACVKLLLEYGADPNIVDDQGRTPLSYAVLWGRENADICRLLLLFKARPDCVYRGSTTVSSLVSSSRSSELSGSTAETYSVIRELCGLEEEKEA